MKKTVEMALKRNIDDVNWSETKEITSVLDEIKVLHERLVEESKLAIALLFTNYFAKHPNAELFIYARVNYDDNGFYGNNIWRVDTDYVRSQGRLKVTQEMMKEIEKTEGGNWVPEELLVAAQQKMKRHKGVRDKGNGHWLDSMGPARWEDVSFADSEVANVLPHESTWPLLRIKDFDDALHSPILQGFWTEFAAGEDNSSSHGALLVRETFEGIFLPGLGYDYKTMLAKIEGDALKQHASVNPQARAKKSAL